MADRLVQWLNERGYQPVYLPAAGVHPPELYVFARPQLVRLGALKEYLPRGLSIPKTTQNKLPDIQIVQTHAKSIKGAAKFVGNALRSLGVTQAPGLDFSFVGAGEFVFRLLDVTYEEISPALLPGLIQKLRTDLIPREYVMASRLHIAYHYAYAARLEMRRKDSGRFDGKISGGEIENLVRVGASASVRVENGDAIVFSPRKSERVAFAYKAGRLRPGSGGLEFFPGEVDHFAADESSGYLAARGQVLGVEDHGVSSRESLK